MNKEYYINNLPDNLPFFMQPYWLDAVSENWDVIIYFKDNIAVACMPYAYKIVKKKLVIYSPLLTQHLGPYIFDSNIKNISRSSLEVEVLSYFVGKIPQFKNFEQKWSPISFNYLPFYWSGYIATVRYTYIFHSPVDPIVVLKNMKYNNRRAINNAAVKLVVEKNDDSKLLYNFIVNSFIVKNNKAPYSFDFFNLIVKKILENNSGQMLFAKNEQGVFEAGVLFVWDSKKIYYLASGINIDVKQNGAVNFLIFKGIELASNTNRSFDFEGSMIENIEFFFRSFGATLTPYLTVSKVNETYLDKIKKLVRGK